jgi:hypothetical protein
MVKWYRGVKIINQPGGNMTKIINSLLSQAKEIMRGFSDNSPYAVVAKASHK